MVTPVFTHNAFVCKDINATLSFYLEICNMKIVKKHGEVYWLTNKNGPLFVFSQDINVELNSHPDMTHLGFDLKTKEEVDRYYKKCLSLGLECTNPKYEGEIAGYLFLVKDPDLRNVEFSAGQITGPEGWDVEI